MGGAVGFPLRDLPHFIAQARAILPGDVRIQVPPNLVSPDEAERNQRENEEFKNIRKLPPTNKDKINCKQEELHKNNLDGNLNNDLNEDNALSLDSSKGKDNFLLSLIQAGARDLGGISPIDEVNPTYHFQKINHLKKQLQSGNFNLVERLPVYERHYTLLSERVRSVVNNNYSNFYA